MRIDEPTLENGHVRLRSWSHADVDCVVEEKACGVPAALDWITRQRARAAEGAGVCLAIADPYSDEALGCVGLNVRAKVGEVPTADAAGRPDRLSFVADTGHMGIGYWVLRRARGRRLATNVVTLLTDWALLHRNVRRAEALVDTANVASIRVLENSGYEREGCLKGLLVAGQSRDDLYVYAHLNVAVELSDSRASRPVGLRPSNQDGRTSRGERNARTDG